MSNALVCTICGDTKSDDASVWFLVAESHWQDRLMILGWQDNLASRSGIHRACCPEHVQELVTHWMAMGTLDFLLVNPLPTACSPRRSQTNLPVVPELDISGAREIGELTVDRESLRRALHDNPNSSQILLDELYDVLEHECQGYAQGIGSGVTMVRAC
jgi:hypothetical protein